MNTTSREVFRLERGDEILISSPTAEDVLNAIQIAYSENGMKGPPELVLNSVKVTPKQELITARLLLLLAFHPTRSPCWLVEYSMPGKKGSSLLLSSGSRSEMAFERRTVCGVISLYREDCLIHELLLLRKAIAWFLETHGNCPEMEWIRYDQAVQDADNTVE